jgi:hypothetical protein
MSPDSAGRMPGQVMRSHGGCPQPEWLRTGTRDRHGVCASDRAFRVRGNRLGPDLEIRGEADGIGTMSFGVGKTRLLEHDMNKRARGVKLAAASVRGRRRSASTRALVFFMVR